MRVALKECLWEPFGDDLIVVSDPREAVIVADPRGRIAAYLEELSEGPKSVAELRGALADRGVRLSEAEVRSALRGLDTLGLVEPACRRFGVPETDERHAAGLAFFGAFTGLDRPRTHFVQRLRDAHVLVLGAGGIGSSIIQCLAGLGVGHFTIVDHDQVEPGDFAHQFLYRRADIGRSKAERAAEWVRDHDPAIEVRAVDRWISSPEDLLDLVGDADVLTGGLDGRPDAHFWLNEAAVRAGLPLVAGRMDHSRLSYYSVDPGRSACLNCAASEDLDPVEHDSAWIATRLAGDLQPADGLIAPLAQHIGSLIACEALRYLTGFESPRAAGSYVHVDLRAGLVPEWAPFPRDPGCPVCAMAPERPAPPPDPR
ncbi:HesA/MoeB/ThiF family protein [Allonocardiopsis opalescens]|uniref:Molybdopterin/thiamine biosynthesis adenylyltransferase n=1 Tax=Allonocardiopsis opalescens TaxID=1144618 RepID=A0A2T0PPD8_9ACTN|nr:ThiF family adenylyltransferase [Allonocardiopsis opalescens]PRX90747.1 molybdopterin/thiamine biosynthesis adenylyltransferase [Allonocardiopsis opalescens]